MIIWEWMKANNTFVGVVIAVLIGTGLYLLIPIRIMSDGDIFIAIGVIVGIVFAFKYKKSDQPYIKLGLLVGVLGGLISSFLISFYLWIFYSLYYGFSILLLLLYMLVIMPFALIFGLLIGWLIGLVYNRRTSTDDREGTKERKKDDVDNLLDDVLD